MQRFFNGICLSISLLLLLLFFTNVTWATPKRQISFEQFKLNHDKAWDFIDDQAFLSSLFRLRLHSFSAQKVRFAPISRPSTSPYGMHYSALAVGSPKRKAPDLLVLRQRVNFYDELMFSGIGLFGGGYGAQLFAASMFFLNRALGSQVRKQGSPPYHLFIPFIGHFLDFRGTSASNKSLEFPGVIAVIAIAIAQFAGAIFFTIGVLNKRSLLRKIKRIERGEQLSAQVRLVPWIAKDSGGVRISYRF